MIKSVVGKTFHLLKTIYNPKDVLRVTKAPHYEFTVLERNYKIESLLISDNLKVSGNCITSNFEHSIILLNFVLNISVIDRFMLINLL